MEKLNLPEFKYRTRVNSKDKTEIFDIIRKKYIVLTPEENVRQNFIHYLLKFKAFPASLMAVEKGLKVNTKIKRTDIVQYNTDGKAILIVECKAPHIKINENTFAQAAMYNMEMKVDYLIMTNGLNHYCGKIDYTKQSMEYLPEIPNFKEL
ncbi:MAG: restriction endonuclease subunit R [Bacteroidetes bacterium]|nr:MAG: restriction endonuclease subunit R [Bacteroidota bacterium]